MLAPTPPDASKFSSILSDGEETVLTVCYRE